ncbi:hypothetical protein BLNAU_8568 [Blattamonas nauphoetae]|uniref:Uncharacterized protein n=1 Tax=Blattamonas nauphoetae TaxID=2049346 RepID=A0ABQ9XYI3_9EUKA|nr:hypothetical protein BLNAU_8568 [Blattamonas nauphoetae]
MESSSPVLNAEGVIEFTSHEQADTETLIFSELFGVQAVRSAETFNCVIRRDPKESNTKAVLDSIRTMIMDEHPHQSDASVERGRGGDAFRRMISDRKDRVHILTHSNSTLIELIETAFSLVGQLRTFLRMGHGSETLNLNNCYSKKGCVDNMLFRRLCCLELVTALANTLPNSHRNLCLIRTCSVSVRMCLATQHFVYRQAKVMAMTRTHTSFAWEDLVKQGFTFDSIVLEVTGSCLEIESFIPLVMQKNVDSHKRIVFIGESRKERPTSLYHRYLCLHVTFLQLTPQGLCKPSISRLLPRVDPNLTNKARPGRGRKITSPISELRTTFGAGEIQPADQQRVDHSPCPINNTVIQTVRNLLLTRHETLYFPYNCWNLLHTVYVFNGLTTPHLPKQLQFAQHTQQTLPNPTFSTPPSNARLSHQRRMHSWESSSDSLPQLSNVFQRKHHLICPKHTSEPSSNRDGSSNSTAVQREWLELLSNHPIFPFRLSTPFPHPPLNLRTQICCWPAHISLSSR